MRFLIKLSYDGTNYSGYQRQQGKDTIQERLEDALKVVNNNQKTSIHASGRTDKGVHALCQYAHADLTVQITEHKLKRALNSNLPNDIHIISTKIVPEDFHARYNVLEKEYCYFINMGEYNPIERNTVYQYNYHLDVEKMKEAIAYFIGKHDFRAFVTENREKENCIREIYQADIEVQSDKLKIVFRGNGFLRYQVRNMVGILFQVGQGKILPSKVKEILESKDRTKNGKTAPACGLYLCNVIYSESKIS